MSFGPTVDILPTITPDGRSITLTVIPRLTEFLGYEGMTDPTNQVVTYKDGKRVKAVLPRPLFRTQAMTNEAVVPDGMTLVLGGSPIERTRLYKDKVPFLGDIPWVGKLFRNETTQVNTNFPLIFVTPKIVNTAAELIRPSTDANKDGSDESFHTSTNLRPIIDVPIY
jgi:type II secretory pathway component GspD/PulD (secretin)